MSTFGLRLTEAISHYSTAKHFHIHHIKGFLRTKCIPTVPWCVCVCWFLRVSCFWGLGFGFIWRTYWIERFAQESLFTGRLQAQYIFLYVSVFSKIRLLRCDITSVTDAPCSPFVLTNGWKRCETFSNPFCMCVYGLKQGCRVSDDTGGVIPQTSVSNLQHEKDTRVTPYLPPTILYPHRAPSVWCCSLSFEPESNSVSGYQRSLPQLAIKHTK